jgi:hypothetical protein
LEQQKPNAKVAIANPNISESWEDFARTVYIRSGLEMVQFDPFDYQKILNHLIDTHRGVVVTKTRQMGLTEFIACKFLHKAARRPGYLALVFSKNQKDTRNIARRIRGMATAHPHIELDGSSLEDLSVKNGGRIVFLTSTPNAGRGFESVSDVLYDECGFVPAIAEIYGATAPSQKMVGNQAKTILLSTPNGQVGFYWEQLNKANGGRNLLEICRQMREGAIAPIQYWTGTNGWAKFIVHFKAHPVYGKHPDFLQEVKEQDNLTEAQTQREYNLGFDENGAQVFASALVHRAARGAWQLPRLNNVYLAGLDPAFGGQDYYTVRVWDVTMPPYQLVAQYRDRYRSKDFFIEKTLELLDPYRPAMMGVEVNGGGGLYLQELLTARPGWTIEGINSTNQSKALHSDRLVLMLERDQLIFPIEPEDVLTDESKASLVGASEYLHFIEEIDGTKRRRSAESGCFVAGTKILRDDCVAIPIEAVQLNYSVITHKGSSGVVYKTMERPYVGEIVRIKASGIPDLIEATPNHPFWAKARTCKNLQRRSVRKEFPSGWLQAGSLKKGDWLAVPKRKGLPKTDLTEDQLWAIGFWLAEGHYIRKSHSKDEAGIGVTNTNIEFLERFAPIMKSWFPTNTVTFNYFGEKREKTIASRGNLCSRKRDGLKVIYDWSFHSSDCLEFMSKHFGSGASEKYIHQDIFNKSGLLALVAGFIDGDGSQRTGQQSDVNIYTSSEQLAWQLRQILLDGNIWCTLRRGKSRNGGKTPWILTIKASFLHLLPSCKVKVPSQRHLRHVQEDENYFYTPIREIETIHAETTVYNFSVDNEHSYVAQGVAVHNCHDDTVSADYVAFAFLDQVPRYSYEYQTTGRKRASAQAIGY